MAEQNQQQGVVELVDAGVPADQGLSSLGLIMQLAGTVFAAYASLAMFVMVIAMDDRRSSDSSQKLWLFLVLSLSIGRSLIQRMAGTELLYGKKTIDGATVSPLSGIKRYVIAGVVQSAILVAIMMFKVDVPAKLALGVGAGLAIWPVVLAVLIQLPRFRRFANEVPVSEDKGFEAAAILMTVLGLCGVLGTGAFLLIMLDMGGRALQQGPGVLIMLATIMLVIRSCLHVQAGLSGLRETSVDRSVELANRYANFGLISSFCAAGAMLMLMMTASMNLMALAMVAGLCWMLMAWPMIIRRFFSDRQFADLLAGDNANLHRRAPDAGLTGLGWLLLAHAVLGAAFLIPQLVIGPAVLQTGMTKMLSFMGPVTTRSIWWSVGMLVLQGWAGFELIRMSANHRMIATVFSIVSGILTVYVAWPILNELKHLGRLGPEGLAMVVPLAIQLVIPVATLILVNRTIAPTARARFRAPPPATTSP